LVKKTCTSQLAFCNSKRPPALPAMPMACSVLEMHVARSFGGADDEVAEPKAGGTLGWLVMACTRLTPCNQPFHQESINQSINRLTPCNPVNQSTNQPFHQESTNQSTNQPTNLSVYSAAYTTHGGTAHGGPRAHGAMLQ